MQSSWLVDAAGSGVRLDKFLAHPDRLGSRGRAASALERGKIFVNDREMGIADAARRLSEGDVVRFWMDRPGSAKRLTPTATGDLEIVYEDDALLVVNKPPGLLSVPLPARSDASSVYDQLQDYFRPRGKRRPFIVHRIDRDTSGLVLFAKDARTQEMLKAQFRRREPLRLYLAVVLGHLEPDAGSWRDHLVWDSGALIQREARTNDPRATEAISHYRVVETFRDASLLEVRLETGKRNQIRVQARLRGHPLIGERKYVREEQLSQPEFSRQALHAHRLAFLHPADGRELRFEAPLPADLLDLLARLRA